MPDDLAGDSPASDQGDADDGSPAIAAESTSDARLPFSAGASTRLALKGVATPEDVPKPIGEERVGRKRQGAEAGSVYGRIPKCIYHPRPWAISVRAAAEIGVAVRRLARSYRPYVCSLRKTGDSADHFGLRD